MSKNLNRPADRGSATWVLTLAALGVVFGDIGTSPLYALRECFGAEHGLAVTPDNIFGVLSLIFWSLVVVISIKYVLYVMHADNKGEGGVLALTALVATRAGVEGNRRRYGLLLIGLFGAALLYGDGMITPAISILGAIEGLEVATPMFRPVVIPITLAILGGLFWVQRRGTQGIGSVFGPVIALWFLTLSVLGVMGILKHPSVLSAVDPRYGWEFFRANGFHGFAALGAVVLVVTGGEALYADMGHFGRDPIRKSWFWVVLPSLLLNYFGQGALLLEDAAHVTNPFYRLAPPWALYPLVALATCAAVIASQALISGAFSITRQAIQLGFLPRMTILHTSESEIGQIYVPAINWMLFVATVWLVVTFGSSSRLAAAYGIAVTTTMVITTILIYRVARDRWKWSPFLALGATAIFLAIDFGFWSANALKVTHGGWVPLALGGVILTLMTSWRKGRSILAMRLKARAQPFEEFLEQIERNPPSRVEGVAVFMTSTLDGTPPALLHNLRHNRVLHDKVVLMMVVTEEIPHVPWAERYTVEKVRNGIFRIMVRYGFMDSPNIPAVLLRCKEPELQFLLSEVTYFLGRETLLATSRPGMAQWREQLFAFMSRNSQRATAYFHIPPSQVVELGLQVEL